MGETLCPSCAEVGPDGARFCPYCGTFLHGPAPAAAHPTERRIITTLFCDLVGFTAFAEQADPEDVDGLLREFYALARQVIQQYGGVVEKFVGDAVVGVFGVPTAHEDDAERAVRAAIRLQERLADVHRQNDGRLMARAGVNTGHALVRLDVDPASGVGFLAGDAVNTAARLQTAAPPGGVVVGEMTRSMAAGVVTYEPMGEVRVKGKARSVRPWLVMGGIASLGMDLKRSFPSPFIGREVELGILTGMFEKAVASRTPQFAFVIADAGLGKSRLLHEFATRLDERSDLIVWWRQARCPAFGERLSTWPLSQIVREHAGIAITDDAGELEAKLLRILDDEPDKEWLASRLRPLIGLPSPPAPKQENFTAWRRFLESLAHEKPTVLVFEDVHWAGPLMAEFLRHVMEHTGDVPLLGLATARPEFLQAYPDYEAVLAAGEKAARVLQLDLHPLADPEMDRLISALSDAVEVADARSAIVNRCGGNPLYAEELVRLLEDEQASQGERSLSETASQKLPASLQTLIAARLDSLDPGLKGLLADAAVIGEVFWVGALTAVARRNRAGVEADLRQLAVRELIRVTRDLSRPGDATCAFWHALTRDVAYGQLTRERRASKHEAVARWLEAEMGDRLPGLADVLAHHYATALEMNRQLHDDAKAARLMEPALRYLRSAGDRALVLDIGNAERHYRRALDLVTDEGTDRAALLVREGRVLGLLARLPDAAADFDEGIAYLLKSGELTQAGEAMCYYADILARQDDPRAWELTDDALVLLESVPPSPQLVIALAHKAMDLVMRLDPGQALAVARRAKRLAADLGLAPSPEILHAEGLALLDSGDVSCLRVLDQAADEARRLGLQQEATRELYNLADARLMFAGPAAAYAVRCEAQALAVRHGNHAAAAGYQAGLCQDLFWAGRWDEASALIDEITRRGDLGSLTRDALWLAATETLLLCETDGATALSRSAWMEATLSPRGTLDERSYCLSARAAAQVNAGHSEKALGVLGGLATATRGSRASSAYSIGVPWALRACMGAQAADLAGRLLDGLVEDRPFERATLAAGRGLLQLRNRPGGGHRIFHAGFGRLARAGRAL